MIQHKTKRILSLFLTLAMLVSLWVPMSMSLAVGPHDIVPIHKLDIQGHWAANDLDEWISKGWLKGNNAGSYMPNMQVSRAQFMAFVNRAMGYTVSSTTVAEYADVPSGAWYHNDVAIALGAGYIQGANGMIRPEAAISRQEAVVILARLAGHEAASVDVGYLALVPDAATIPSWAKSAASIAVREGLIAGIDGKFEGERSITRAESVVLLNRFVTNTRVFGFAGTYGGTTAAPLKSEMVVIAAPGITLEHAVINGTVEVTAGVGNGDAILRDVVINENLNVNGGGNNSVYLIRVTVGDTLGVWKPDVRVVIVEETDIEAVKLYANATIDASDAQGAINVEIIAASEDGGVTLTGDFDSVTNMATGLALTIDGHVNTLVLDAGATITGAANIGTAVISKEAGKDTIFDKSPGRMAGDGKNNATVLERTPSGGYTPNPGAAAGTIAVDDLSAMTMTVGRNGGVAVTATASNGNAVTIAAASNVTGVATVTVAGKTITVTAIAVGTATITVTASAANCPDVVKTFMVTVSPFVPGEDFVLFNGSTVPKIYVDATDHKQIIRAVNDLRDDIERVTTMVPEVQNTTENLGNRAIIVGSLDSQVIKDMIDDGKLDEAKGLVGMWESYLIKLVDNPIDGVEQAIVIVGSDKRGGVYGIYDLSEQIGVSPWYYWGDILPVVQDEIIIDTQLKVQGEPSVKYRGIFINDEQNMAYWAALTEEKEPGTDWENGNINPDTYAKVYELLLRLKANYLWPAMHSEPRLGPDANSTKKLGAIDHFNKYPENRILADEYGIIIGTSHCEPMMRNGTAEYVEYMQDLGYLPGFNYPGYTGKVEALNNRNDIIPYDYSIKGNRSIIDEYWRTGVTYYEDYETSYTLGMRGLHDEGFRTTNANSTQTKLPVLQAVIDSQIDMLKGNKNPDSFPIFIPYKEVLTLYEAGLELPEETIIVWAEDNQGHIRRFPTAEEREKYAGSGVYYHLNYEGTGSYSWLNSVSPNLMLSEMRKAYESGVQALWVLNVGDIKPSEISMELFLEMAWDIDRWNGSNLEGTAQDPGYYELLSQKWFPDVDSREAADLIEGYFHLVEVLKPDHTTGNNGGKKEGFSSVNYGDELMQRVAEFQELAERAQVIYDDLYDSDRAQADAFYQHVAYPIIGTYYNNLKYYHSQKNALYLEQGRTAAANLHAALVDWAHDQENIATEYYNTGISNGKWKGIMQPHNSNNLRSDRSPKPSKSTVTGIPYMSKMGVVTEGERVITDNSALNFSAYLEDTHFVDLFNMGTKGFAYTITSDKTWVIVSESDGTVYDDLRLFVDIDWGTLSAGDQTATLTITGAGESKTIQVNVSNPATNRTSINGYAEANGYVAIEAEHFTENVTAGDIGFFLFEGLGRAGDAVSAGPMGSATYNGNLGSAPYLTYQVYFQTAGTFTTTVYRIPTLETGGQRVAIGVDNGNPTVSSGQAIAESGNWEKNVVNGIEKLSTALTIPSAGYHTIKLYMVDAGVAIDRIVINTGGEADSNQGPPESYHSEFNPNPGMYNQNNGTTPRLLSMHQEYLEAYITGTVEPLIATLEGEVHTVVQTALNEVTATLEQPLERDTVRRAYGKLASVVASVHAMQNIDTLLAQAVSRGADIIKNGNGGIPVYVQSAVDTFETTYDVIAEAVADSELMLTQKMNYYEQLMLAMNTVESSRVVTVTSSTSESANVATNAIDGNPSTRWAASSGSYPQWIEVDLGDIYSLDQIAITWYNNGSNVTNGTRAYKYTVSTSADKNSYTQVVDRSSNTTAYNTVTDSLNQTQGRYVRIDVSGANGGSASIFEIVISGTKPESAEEEALNALLEEIEKAELVDASSYTIDSYNNLMTLADLGKTLLDGSNGEMVIQTTTNLRNAYAALKTKGVVVNESFDELEAGNYRDVLSLTGWSFEEAGGTVTLVENDGNNYLKIEQSTKTNSVVGARWTHPTGLSGKVYVEVKVRSDAGGTPFCAPFLYGSETANGNNTLCGAQLRENTKIASSYKKGDSATTAVGAFAEGQWNTICLVMDTETYAMQVYVNGVRKDDGNFVLRNNLNALKMIRFYSDDTKYSLAHGYIDNVLVYTEGENITPPGDDTLQQIARARTDLQNAIDTAEAFDEADDHTIDSYTALSAAISGGQAELAKQEHLLADLESCIEAIEGAIGALVARSYILNESFDTLEAGNYRDVLALAGWSFEETNGVVTLAEDGGNNYLKIEQSNKTNPVVGARWTHPTGLSGKVYVEVKVRSDAGGTPFCAPFLYGSETADGNNTLCGAQLREDTKIASSYQKGSSSTKQVGTFVKEQWNTICLIMDTTTYKVQVYVNGMRKDDGTYVLRNNLDALKMIRLYSDDKAPANSTALGYVDNVRVYIEQQP